MFQTYMVNELMGWFSVILEDIEIHCARGNC